MYDYRNDSVFSADDCRKAVGKRATLAMTGVIADWSESTSGPFVKFQPDERWGFGDLRLGIDLDALEIEKGGRDDTRGNTPCVSQSQ